MHARLVLFGDIALGVVLFVLAWWLGGATDRTALLVVGPAVAAGIAGRTPTAALGLVWAAALLQSGLREIVLPAWIALPVVAYRVARHGSRPTVWAAGISVPIGSAVAVYIALHHPVAYGATTSFAAVVRDSGGGVVTALVALVALNAAPLALGLAVRVTERYRRAEARAVTEHEVAQARAGQTRLARDVHDVVGHSLAVIIAQADAAQLTAGDDAVRTTLARISAVGRSSLAEVRDVLARTDEPPSGTVPTPAPELDEPIDGVRSAGNDVADRVVGTPTALDEATAGAAYRVLQEMLTNSLKHGVPGGPIEVDRSWTPDGLTLRVTNPVGGDDAGGTSGMGLPGLRQRVDAVGGTFRTGTVTIGARPRFVATAFLPAGRG